MSQSPVRIDFRAYNVCFGDCLLLSFTYAAPIDGRAERHILLDFGSTKAAKGGPSLRDVAALIEADTHGKLDAVVLTHRHRDHLAGVERDDAVLTERRDTHAGNRDARHGGTGR